MLGRVAMGIFVFLACMLGLGPFISTASAHDAYANIGYDVDGSIPVPPDLNQLDIYAPEGTEEGDGLPVVVYIHDGEWRSGSRSEGVEEEAELFTARGFLFVSVSHRLSPDPIDSTYPSERIKHPDHVRDLAEALGWIDRTIRAYGGDRRRVVLLGAGSGAHLATLVATDPEYLESRLFDARQLIGVVGLAGYAYDIPSALDAGDPGRIASLHNAFGGLSETSGGGSWVSASPVTHADPADPQMLLIVPAADFVGVAGARRMAEGLGRSPGDVIDEVPLGASEAIAALGAPGDPAGVSTSALAFTDRVLAANEARRVSFRTKPKRVVRLRGKQRNVRVRFAFSARGKSTPGSATEQQFLCRRGAKVFRACTSPRRIRLGPGRHFFRVRAEAPNGSRGPVSVARVRVRR